MTSKEFLSRIDQQFFKDCFRVFFKDSISISKISTGTPAFFFNFFFFRNFYWDFPNNPCLISSWISLVSVRFLSIISTNFYGKSTYDFNRMLLGVHLETHLGIHQKFFKDAFRNFSKDSISISKILSGVPSFYFLKLFHVLSRISIEIL